MLNQIILVGRLTRDINVYKSDKGVKVATISLAIPRSFKNMDGNYDTDFVDCVAFDAIAENTAEYCGKGDIVGVKGRVQSRTYEKKYEDGSVETRVAYEVSIGSLEVIEEKDNEKEAENQDQEAV